MFLLPFSPLNDNASVQNFDHPDALAYAMAGLALPAPPGSSDPNLALAPVDQVPAPAPPAWRTVNKRAERKPRAPKKGVPQAIPTPSQVPPLEVPRPNVPAWSQWRRECFSLVLWSCLCFGRVGVVTRLFLIYLRALAIGINLSCPTHIRTRISATPIHFLSFRNYNSFRKSY